MAVRVLSGALEGVEALPIEVEVDLLARLPSVCIVGLAASAVKESSERLRSALQSSGESLPRKRVVVNLAPADVKKESTALDLPMALGILAAAGRIPASALERILAVGELSLAGQLRPVRGALSLALLARRLGRTLVLPRGSASTATLVPDVQIVGADTLSDVIRWLEGAALEPIPRPSPSRPPPLLDLAEVRGQPVARRALEIAAAGGHHLLMIGPPGCGKSMLAQRLPTILPPLSFDEALETTRVHSAAGHLADGELLLDRPFRAPHHSVTVAAMVGDRSLRPGEVSLAHNGVLFLDEAPEFTRSVIEVLRQPLEDGVVRLSRARGAVTHPASITLVMAANPCPCGLRGVAGCGCTDTAVHRYLQRLSGPILDRIDLHVSLSALTATELFEGPSGETSAVVRERVVMARQRQWDRGQRVANGQLSAEAIHRCAALTVPARALLVQGAERHGLSGRSATRVLKVARTVADLAGADTIAPEHVRDALAFRPAEL
ncbi:MAG: YifB family Mg chelatase-like AAA ATPase [Myxococcota bacterium]